MKEVFLTSRYSNDIYKLIVKACLDDVKKKNKKNEIAVEVIKIKIKFDYNFLLNCLIFFFSGKFFKKENIALLKYKNVEFGKYLLSTTFRSYVVYTSHLKFLYYLIKNIFKVSIYYKNADYYLKKYNFNYFYIDHLEYLNGIIGQIFVNNNKCIFSNRHPRNIIKTKKKNFEEIFQIKYFEKKLSNHQIKKIKNKNYKIFKTTKNIIPWMYHTKFRNFNNKKLDKYNYIIYAHSFTDSQCDHGYDGFVNNLDWLKFTVDFLNKRRENFIIKAHPNFYINTKISSLKELSEWDRKIYFNFIEKYKKLQNILIIDKPIENRHLINLLNKKCIAITKHGTVQLEMIYHGFKVIASKKNVIDPKFCLANSWNNKSEYAKILEKNWKALKFANYHNFLNLVEYLFMNKNTIYGENFYLNILKKKIFEKKILKKNPSTEMILKKFNSIKYKDTLIKNLTIPISKI